MVPGHRDLYKEAGITKQQIKVGRTKIIQQTPEQEHQSRADGTPIIHKRKPEELVLDEQKMKELMDWMWRTRHSKKGDEDKKWAPAAEIPKQFRPKLNQLMQYDWLNLTPYPGWVLAVEQGCSGWKCKLMTDEEIRAYETGVGKTKNPKSIKRANDVALAAKLRTEKVEAENARHRQSEPSSSSGTRQNRTSGAENRETSPTSDAENEPETETAVHRKTPPTSDAEDSYSAESVVPDDDLRTRCMDELGVPLEEINNTMLSLYVEIGNLSHACDLEFLGMGPSIEAEIPKAVTPLHTDTKYPPGRPSVFVLTSTNHRTKKQWTETCNDLEGIGLEVVPVLGLDGEDIPCMAQAWRRAQTAWALKGFPFIHKCINKTPSNDKQQDWFIIAEDSAKLFQKASIEAIQSRLRNIPPGVEILQTGYRKANKRKQMRLLDLSTMGYIREDTERKVTKNIGQKLFVATRKGVKLLLHRLLKGVQEYFDTSMCQLIRANVAIRDDRPMAGSRAHYSLVDGGKWQDEEMPNQKVTFADLQEEELP